LMPKGGQIVDASLVNVPKNRNTRDENKQIKEGKTPDGWADSAYRSEAREQQLSERDFNSRIHRKGTSHRRLNKQEKATNHRRSKVRARVEHVFGDQRTRQGNILVRTKGKVRAAVKIGLMNLTYNMRRLEFLLRPQSPCYTG